MFPMTWLDVLLPLLIFVISPDGLPTPHTIFMRWRNHCKNSMISVESSRNMKSGLMVSASLVNTLFSTMFDPSFSSALLMDSAPQSRSPSTSLLSRSRGGHQTITIRCCRSCGPMFALPKLVPNKSTSPTEACFNMMS